MVAVAVAAASGRREADVSDKMRKRGQGSVPACHACVIIGDALRRLEFFCFSTLLILAHVLNPFIARGRQRRAME